MKAEPKIEILYDSVVTRLISGIDVLEEIEVKNVKTGAVSPLKVSGLFVAIGTQPNNELLKGKLALSSEGYLLTDEAMQTNVLGVYGAGDIRKKPLRQIITAAADGALAAYQASRYIGES